MGLHLTLVFIDVLSISVHFWPPLASSGVSWDLILVSKVGPKPDVLDVFSVFPGKTVDISGFLDALASRNPWSLLKKMGSTQSFGPCKKNDVCLEAFWGTSTASYAFNHIP